MGWWFAASKPKKVKGGIRSHSKRGDFGKSWWARRWIRVLDGYDIGERMSRGRSYLRKGQIVSVDIQKGAVTARVQGSDSSPYKVTIIVPKLSEEQWRRVTPALFARPATAAKLLTRQMPEDIEEIFHTAKVPLFPSKSKDLKTDCDCYDWANPCKHIVAVYLLIGEELDRDPFIMFRLRGAEREDVLKMAGFYNAGMTDTRAIKRKTARPSKPLSVRPKDFWRYESGENQYSVDMRVPEVQAALPKWLGNFQFWRGKKDFMQSLEAMYHDASKGEFDAFAEK